MLSGNAVTIFPLAVITGDIFLSQLIDFLLRFFTLCRIFIVFKLLFCYLKLNLLTDAQPVILNNKTPARCPFFLLKFFILTRIAFLIFFVKHQMKPFHLKLFLFHHQHDSKNIVIVAINQLFSHY